MAFSLIPNETNIRFTKYAPIAQVISAVAIIASIAAFFVMGLNFGIDFRGGVTIEVGAADGHSYSNEELQLVRDAVGALDLGDVQVQTIGGALPTDPNNIVVFVEAQPVPEETVPVTDEGTLVPDGLQAEGVDTSRAADVAQQAVLGELKTALRAALGDDVDFRREDVVGPTVSGELVKRGASALAWAIGLMLVYIWFRFEWQFSLGAITALVHDVILTIGMFAVTQLDFTLSIIAALLTIIGYSMNDTVVVFDRVRENLRRFKKRPLAEVIDLSINQTLARTIMTSVTTLLALVSLFFLGGEVLRGFSFAMIWGVVIGTYSSVFIASPVLLRTGVTRDVEAKKAERKALATP